MTPPWPITPQPLEAASGVFGVPINTDFNINSTAKEAPVLSADGVKFVTGSPLFRHNNSTAPTSTRDSKESPTLFKTPLLVSNSTVSTSPLLHTPANTLSPVSMSRSVSSSHKFDSSTATSNFVSGILDSYPFSNPPEAAMKKMFDECLVGDVEDDSSFLYTPHTNATNFTTDTLMTGTDSPSIDLAQIDSYLHATSSFAGDFNIYGDLLVAPDEWQQTPLFTGAAAEDSIAPYSLFKNNSATVTSASPQQFSIPNVKEEQLSVKPEPLPTPELSPPTARKTRKAAPAPKPVRKVSATPFTPITPATTTPSTPQPAVTLCTKRRIPVTGEDPAIVEKRRRNTVAAQRSRARKQEEKAEDKARIATLEKEAANLRTLVSYWKDRACELGASPLEDGEN